MKITKYYIKWKNDKTGETGQGKQLFVDYDEVLGLAKFANTNTDNRHWVESIEVEVPDR